MVAIGSEPAPSELTTFRAVPPRKSLVSKISVLIALVVVFVAGALLLFRQEPSDASVYTFDLEPFSLGIPTLGNSVLVQEHNLNIVAITTGITSLSRPLFFSQGPFNPDYNKQRVAFIVSENRSVIVPFTPRKVTQEVKLQNRTTRI